MNNKEICGGAGIYKVSDSLVVSRSEGLQKGLENAAVREAAYGRILLGLV